MSLPKPAEIASHANTFQPFALDGQTLVTLADDPYPSEFQTFGAAQTYLNLRPLATHYIIVASGEINLLHGGGAYRLRAGMFAVVPGSGSIDAESIGEAATGLVITRLGWTGLFQIGGPLEPQGRLKYIDRCSDTLLVGPPIKGDPCLNHLHMPAGVDQTAHTHPSQRIGIILRGRGECRTPGATVALTPGMGWWIPTGCEHSFFTFDESMDVIAWHPDSDTGPSHDDHPMVNRTYVDDVSARDLTAIRTTEIV